MYTQCPDCEIAFKVTADVLRQAGGKVRCGGCSNAFNALDYLSEQMPHQADPSEDVSPLPELTAETTGRDSDLPKSMSAEQSAALLKTLDQLAGSDIRIEDTGVEWRVLDDDDDLEAPAANYENGVDELLDDDPTPIDEFLTATPDVVDSPEIFADSDSGAEPDRPAVDELRFDDNTPLPDDFDEDDAPPAVSDAVETDEAESEGLAADEGEIDEPAQIDIALSEPDEWTDILGEFEDLVENVAAPADLQTEKRIDAGGDNDFGQELDNALSEDIDDTPLDVDTQFALQAESMGIDLSGVNQIEAEPDDDIEALHDEAGGSEIEGADVQLELIDEIAEEASDDLSETVDSGSIAELIDAIDDKLDGALDDQSIDEQQFDERMIDEPLTEERLIDEPIVESHSIEDELSALAEDEVPESNHVIPEMTEEEHTVNMQIDQDLMALAIEDEDGFASTLIIPEDGAKGMLRSAEDDHHISSENIELGADSIDDSDEESGFETIIMEGETVRTALDRKQVAEDVATAAAIAELRESEDAEQSTPPASRRYGLIAAAVVLVLVFALQIVHQSREALATIPAFNDTIGQVYQAIGRPVQPAWDVAGWRIEASNDVISEEIDGQEKLTAYSRIGNNSDQAMPYPLLAISLTDRFLEPVGMQILDPAEYLPTDLDPQELVVPGNSFNAVIAINAPPAETTGYKVDVCYRLTDGRLRCAMDDFK